MPWTPPVLQTRGVQPFVGDTGAAPGFEAGGKLMKRSHVLLSLVVLLVALALPAFARAEGDPPAPTAIESAAATLSAIDGWTWDEAVSSPDPAPDGWTWDEAAPPVDTSPDGWTWDEATAPGP